MKIAAFYCKKRGKKPVLRTLALSLTAFFVWVSVFFIIRGALFPVSLASAERKLPIYSVSTAEKKVAISFDCA